MAFPTSGLSNNQVHKEGNRSFVYDSALGVWDQVRETDRTENKILSGEIGSEVTGGSGLDDLPNKHNKSISRVTGTGFNTSSSTTLSPSWVIANIGNSDEVMTQSAGIFTFPSTGIWRLETRASVYNSTATAFNCEGASFDTYESTNGGGSWAHIIAAHNHITFPANDWYRTPLYGSAILDVTNTSSYKIKFACGTNPSANLHWSWSGTNSCILFLKMGPT